MTVVSTSDNRSQLLLGVLLIILSGIVAGAVLPLTQALAGFQDGDGILTSLISTQKLTALVTLKAESVITQVIVCVSVRRRTKPPGCCWASN